jgi:TonB family protein
MKLCAFLLLAAVSWAQSNGSPVQNSATSNQPDAVLTKLFPLKYPPLARQARISGDVKLSIHVRPDGTVASAEALSGHPMLKSAAVEDAMKSEFECKGCTGETEYLLIYTFRFIEDLTVYDKFQDRPARAGKCLYFWKCGMVRVQTSDYCSANVPPEITQSPGHVKILVLPVCVQTMSSYSTVASR